MSASAELSCRKLVELVTEYLEGTLPAAERRRFDEHLADCDDCTKYLEQLRVTIRALGHLREEQIAPSARERLLSAFRDWNRSPGVAPAT